MSVITAHMVYFCACARSEIFPKNTRELGVGLGHLLSGVNGLMILLISSPEKPFFWLKLTQKQQNISTEAFSYPLTG